MASPLQAAPVVPTEHEEQSMKEIKAIIRPVRLDDVREALGQVAGFPGMTITHCLLYTSPSPRD